MGAKDDRRAAGPTTAVQRRVVDVDHRVASERHVFVLNRVEPAAGRRRELETIDAGSDHEAIAAVGKRVIPRRRRPLLGGLEDREPVAVRHRQATRVGDTAAHGRADREREVPLHVRGEVHARHADRGQVAAGLRLE